MLEKIIIGLIIGFVGGIFLSKNGDNRGTSALISMFFAIISIAFIVSSFMYGAVYGLMAIGEIGFGFFVAFSIFNNE